MGGVVQVDQVPGFWIFLKSASRLLPGGWVEFTSFHNRCHFRAFQLELDTLGTKNFGIGPVVKKLRLFEVGQILENPAILRCSAPSESHSGDNVILLFRHQK